MDPDAVDQLYSLPLEEFTAARNRLARELTRAGDSDGAATVKALAKPSAASWALNQLARERPEELRPLLDAGDALRAAQEEALAGDASHLRAAGRALQDEVFRVTDVAVAVLAAAGRRHGSNLANRISRTLQAAAVERAAREVLEAGRLVEDLEPAAFGPSDLAILATSGAEDREEEARRTAARAALDEARRDADRLDAEAEEASRRAAEARRRAEEAERGAQEARRRADEAARRMAAAEEKLDEVS